MKRTTAVVDTAVAPLLPCGPALFRHAAVGGEAGSPPLGEEGGENGVGRAAEEAAPGKRSSLAAAQHPALQQPATFIDMRKRPWGKWCRCWTSSS
jgi:hypothetical protein